jgi:hypothetical protein
MEFRVKELRRAALDSIASLRRKHEQDQKKKLQDWSDAKHAWMLEHGQEWAAACFQIRRRLRAGHPVTREDLPSRNHWSGGQIQLFQISEPKESEFQEPTALREIVAVLDLITDETVTTNALAEVGIPRGIMRQVVQHLPAGKGV